MPKRTEEQQLAANKYLLEAQNIAEDSGADDSLFALNVAAAEVGVRFSLVIDPPGTRQRAISRDLEGWTGWYG